MKNNIFKLLTLIAFTSVWADNFGQIAHNDAIRLSAHAKKGPTKILIDTSSAVYEILDYHIDTSRKNTIAEINFYLASHKNPFIEFLGTTQDMENENELADRNRVENLFASISSGIGNANVSVIADAVAQLVVKRMKEELSAIFFQNFKATLQENSDLQILFKNTYSVLMVIDKNIYDYNTYIHTLRIAFEKDLSMLYANMPQFLYSPQFDKLFKLNRNGKDIIILGFNLVNRISAGQNAVQIINELAQIDFNNDSSNIKGILQTTALLSNSLLSTDTNRVWISVTDMFKLVSNDSALRIYLGLLYIRAEGINLFGDSLRGYLAKLNNDTKLFRIKDNLILLANNGEQLKDVINDIKSAKKPLTPEQYSQYFTVTIQSLKSVISVLDTGFSVPVNQEVFRYFDVAQEVNNLYLSINQKKYSVAIVSTVNLIDLVTGVNYKNYSLAQEKQGHINMAKDNSGTIKKAHKKEAKRVKKEIKTLEDINADLDNFKEKFLKYASFMAAVVEADSADQLEAVLDAYILPSGSSAMKGQYPYLLTLNSYIGGFYSWKTDKSDTMRQSAGLSLPIGPNFSKSLNCKAVGAVSLFMPLVDIGAFGAYRLNDSSSAALPDVKLSNIFAPGIMLGLNRIGNTPLTLMVGIQKTPPLQKITATNTTVYESAWRWQVSLTWDIPFFNLYYKPKK